MDKMREYSLATSSGHVGLQKSSFWNTEKESTSTITMWFYHFFLVCSQACSSNSKNYPLKSSIPGILLYLICHNYNVNVSYSSMPLSILAIPMKNIHICFQCFVSEQSQQSKGKQGISKEVRNQLHSYLEWKSII